MCLITKYPIEIKKADKDITVYKIIRKDMHTLFAPYQTDYVYGCEEDLPIYLKESDNFDIYNPVCKLPYHILVSSGGFHVFLNKEGAITCSQYYLDSVYKCTIPKGTEYIMGIFDKFGSACTKELIIEELCV